MKRIFGKGNKNNSNIKSIIAERSSSLGFIINRGIIIIMVGFLLVFNTYNFIVFSIDGLKNAHSTLKSSMEDLDSAAEAYLNHSITSSLQRYMDSGFGSLNKPIYDINTSDIMDFNGDGNIDTQDIDSFLRDIRDEYDQKEVSIISPEGIIVYSTNDDFVGHNIIKDEKLSNFFYSTLHEGNYVDDEFVLSPDGKDKLQYGGIIIDSDCFLAKKGSIFLIGFNTEKSDYYRLKYARIYAKNTRVGLDGGYLILEKRIENRGYYKVIEDSISDSDNMPDFDGMTYNYYIKFPLGKYEPDTMFKYVFNGSEYYCMYEAMDKYVFVAMITTEEVMKERNSKIGVSLTNDLVLFTLIGIVLFGFLNKHVSIPINRINRNLEEICEGNLDIRVKVLGSSEFAMLSDDINIMVLTMKRYIKQAEARIDKELSIARGIQISAVPHVFPPFPDRHEFDIYAYMNTAKEVGGDFYDYFFIDDDHFAMVIADVSDKGIPAAMFMMTSKSQIRDRALQGGTPAQILSYVNNMLCEDNDQKLFITVWLAIVELSTGNIIEANAGHEHPGLYRQGEYRLVKYPHSPPMALMKNLPYTNREYTLYPGDRIFVYTDGVTDAKNEKGERFGEEKLEEALNNTKEMGSEETITSLKNDIDSFVNGALQFDDITMCAFSYFG